MQLYFLCHVSGLVLSGFLGCGNGSSLLVFTLACNSPAKEQSYRKT